MRWKRDRFHAYKSEFGEINMFKVKEFEKDDIDSVIAERETDRTIEFELLFA